MRGVAMKNRSVVFVIRDKKILMEKLCYEGRTFYSIPGGGIEDGEVALKAYCLCLVTQDAGEDSVESAHPEPAGTLLTHQLCDT